MTLGFGLSIAAMSSCRFVEVDGVTDYGEEFSGVGLYWFESPDGQCFFMDPGFDPQDFDLQDLDATDFGASDLDFWVAGKLIVARVFSACSALLSAGMMFMLWFGVCCGCCHGKCLRSTIAVVSIVICAIMGLIFIVFSAQPWCSDGCSFNTGSAYALVAMICYLFCAVVLCLVKSEIPPSGGNPQQPAGKPAAGGPTVTEERTENPDGSITTTKTTIHPDGGQTIEETTETPLIQAVVDEKV